MYKKKLKAALVLLEKAFALIRNKKRWCQHTTAKNKKGKDCLPRSKEAVQWCSYGALLRYSTDKSPIQELAFEKLKQNCVGGPITTNDMCYFETVKDMWRNTINKTKEEILSL